MILNLLERISSAVSEGTASSTLHLVIPTKKQIKHFRQWIINTIIWQVRKCGRGRCIFRYLGNERFGGPQGERLCFAGLKLLSIRTPPTAHLLSSFTLQYQQTCETVTNSRSFRETLVPLFCFAYFQQYAVIVNVSWSKSNHSRL